MTDIKEFVVDPRDSPQKVIYLVKEFLKANKKIKVVAYTNCAPCATRVTETLKRFGYIEYDDVQTETLVDDGRRKTRIVITIHNSPNFDKLYQENEEAKKTKEEERKKAEEKK